MKRARASLVCLLLLLVWMPQSANAQIPGTGVVVGTDALFASGVGGEGHGYFVVAYHLPESGDTRVVARRDSAPLGVAPHDDVVTSGDALEIGEISPGIWALSLEVTLPTIGYISLLAVSDEIDGSGTGCGGLATYEFHSPSNHLTGFGNIYGSIDGHEIQSWSCLVWGWDVYGAFSIVPVSHML